MSSDGGLEAEDLEIIQLVRMDDVQPRNPGEIFESESDNSSGLLETCVVDNNDFEGCVMDDNNSNVGSMVSIKSDEVQEDVIIVPEALETDDVQEAEPIEISVSEVEHMESEELQEVCESQCVPIQIVELVDVTEATLTPKPPPISWPTLEILPGGVINQIAEKGAVSDAKTRKEMSYACAKCSQSFRHLFCLVKHVKWHEDQHKKKKLEGRKLNAAKSTNKICAHALKKRCKKIPKKS